MKRPFFCVKDLVIFPDMLAPIYVGRAASKRAVESAIENFNGEIVVITQRKALKESLNSKKDLYSMGTLAKIRDMNRLKDGSFNVHIQGLHRFQVETVEFKPEFTVSGKIVPEAVFKKRKLSERDKLEWIQLFIHAKPHLFSDHDTVYLKELLMAKSDGAICQIIESYVNLRNPVLLHQELNKRRRPNYFQVFDNLNYHGYQTLAAKSMEERMTCLRKYLSEYSKLTLNDLTERNN